WLGLGLSGLLGPCGLVRRARSLASRDPNLLQSLAIDVERMVAGGQVAPAVIHERRLDLFADVRHVSASGMEAAAGRWIDRARHVALEDDPLAFVSQIGIRDRDGRKERLGVG